MSFTRAIATVGSFTLLSRIAGFARDIVLSTVLGSGAVADAFFVAFKLPNFFRRLFAEGAFSAAFVPLFARELQEGGRAEALAFARQAQAALLLVLVPFTVLLVLAMPGVMAVLAPGMRDDAPTFAMAIEFGRIAFPYLLFISLVSLYGGVLNSIDRFAHVAATPILLNLTLIGAVLGLTPFLPSSGHAAALGVAIAGVLQWRWLLTACARDDARHPARLTTFAVLPGKRHTFEVLVAREEKSAKIQLKLDDNLVIDWKGPPDAFNAGEWHLPDPKQIGIGGMGSPRVLHELKLHMIDGAKATLLRPPQPTPGLPK